jgi:hypothetical protein
MASREDPDLAGCSGMPEIIEMTVQIPHDIEIPADVFDLPL